MMGEIYNNASRIIIWLGKHDDKSRGCINNMWKWYDLVLDFTARYPTWEEMSRASQDWLYEVGILDPNGQLANREAWIDFTHFKSRQWWQRVWTIQEYLPEVDKLFLCGDSTFTHHCLYEAFFLVKLILGSDAQDDEFLSDATNAVIATENLRRNHNDADPNLASSPNSLYNLLFSCRFRSATDPRDKVFALMGLLGQNLRNDPLLSINYSLPTSTVFTNVAEHMLCKTRCLTWLGAVLPPNANSQVCPSWVPDWSDTRSEIMNLPDRIEYIPGVTPNGVCDPSNCALDLGTHLTHPPRAGSW